MLPVFIDVDPSKARAHIPKRGIRSQGLTSPARIILRSQSYELQRPAVNWLRHEVLRGHKRTWPSLESIGIDEGAETLENDHAAPMNALAEEGLAALGSPLGEGERLFLLIFNADSEKAVETRLAADPWTPMRLLQITRIEPWEILLEKPS